MPCVHSVHKDANYFSTFISQTGEASAHITLNAGAYEEHLKLILRFAEECTSWWTKKSGKQSVQSRLKSACGAQGAEAASTMHKKPEAAVGEEVGKWKRTNADYTYNV